MLPSFTQACVDAFSFQTIISERSSVNSRLSNFLGNPTSDTNVWWLEPELTTGVKASHVPNRANRLSSHHRLWGSAGLERFDPEPIPEMTMPYQTPTVSRMLIEWTCRRR
jgi:uncharacterized Zn-finger protein